MCYHGHSDFFPVLNQKLHRIKCKCGVVGFIWIRLFKRSSRCIESLDAQWSLSLPWYLTSWMHDWRQVCPHLKIIIIVSQTARNAVKLEITKTELGTRSGALRMGAVSKGPLRRAWLTPFHRSRSDYASSLSDRFTRPLTIRLATSQKWSKGQRRDNRCSVHKASHLIYSPAVAVIISALQDNIDQPLGSKWTQLIQCYYIDHVY